MKVVRDAFDDYTVPEPNTGCLLWTGGVQPSGYGQVRGPGGRKGTVLFAHRIAWERANGRPVPKGLFVLHSCDVRSCVNPFHLRIGTQAENIRDMLDRRRNRNQNTDKTHCKYGHEFTADNLGRAAHLRGHRSCRACSRRKSKEANQRIRLARLAARTPTLFNEKSA